MIASELPKVTNRNFRKYLKTFLPEIPLDELEHIYRRGGDSFAFWYGDDRILKVGRHEASRRCLKLEFELLTYLHQFDHEIQLPEPIQGNEDGLYAIYRRIDGDVLTPEAVAAFSDEQLSVFARQIGTFLSFLHTHPFPDTLLDQMEIEGNTFEVMRKRSLRKIQIIREFGGEDYDTDRWEADLERLCQTMQFDACVIHCDLGLDHVLSLPPGGFAIIDFADTLINDRYVDLLSMELPRELLDELCAHYEPGAPALEERIAYRDLLGEIQRANKAVDKARRAALRGK